MNYNEVWFPRATFPAPDNGTYLWSQILIYKKAKDEITLIMNLQTTERHRFNKNQLYFLADMEKENKKKILSMFPAKIN